MHPLDNPIYAALSSRQASFAEGGTVARRFIPTVTTLAGLEAPSIASYAALASLAGVGETAGVIVDEAPEPMTAWTLVHDAPLLQMVLEVVRAEVVEHDFIDLTAADSSDMVALAELTKPGPFGPRTHELGGFIGIRHETELAAMAGYRMRVTGFTEVSGICTHPAHAGRGYARALTSALIARIIASGETPFLHVRESNDRAVQLYQRMGFCIRHRRRFVVLQRTAAPLADT